MLMVGFQGLDVPDSLARLLESPLVSGVIWFTRNIVSSEQVARTNGALLTLRPDLLIAVDQEGGPVRRFKDMAVPPMREVSDEASAIEWGRFLGSQLRAMGFNMNMAPVLDVDSNPDNPIIGERSFGSEPGRVARLGLALAQGLIEKGVCPVGKHFPGHGDTAVDSHLALPTLTHQRPRLDAVELVPFKAAIRAELPALMTAHILLPAFDEQAPATLSPSVIDGLLRAELGYQGLVITDDLEMKAVWDRYPIEESTERGLGAGVDIMLICHQLSAQQASLRVLERSERARVDRSLARIAGVVERFPARVGE